jgi:hypothetical protein
MFLRFTFCISRHLETPELPALTQTFLLHDYHRFAASHQPFAPRQLPPIISHYAVHISPAPAPLPPTTITYAAEIRAPRCN